MTLSPSSSSSIDVTWDAPVISGGGSATIAGYKISWTPPHNSGVKTVTGTATSDQITGLNGNTAYSVTVAAMSSASGVGALSDSKSAATGDVICADRRYDVLTYFSCIVNFTNFKQIYAYK